MVNRMFEPATPLILPATEITFSNVPPFISDEFLIKELCRHGKVVSPIRKVLSGCNSPLLRHVVSHCKETTKTKSLIIGSEAVWMILIIFYLQHHPL